MRAKPIQQLNTGYNQTGYDPVISFQQGSQIQLYSIRMINESGGPANLAVLQALSEDAITVFTNISSVLTDVSSLLLNNQNIPFFGPTAGDGLIIQTHKKIQGFMVNVSVDQSGPETFTIEYSNGSGFSSVLQTVNIPVTFNGAPNGKFAVLFSPGINFAPGCGLLGTDDTQYQIKFSCVSGGATCSINALKAAIMVSYSPAIPDNSSLELLFSEQYPLLLEGGESIVPFFSASSSDNKVIAFYQYQD